MGKLEYRLAQRSDAAHSLASANASCWICLDGEEDSAPLVRNCGCRGDAGYAHIECLAAYAEQKEDEMIAQDKITCDPWKACVICLQPYMGRVNEDLADLHYEKYKHLDPKADGKQFLKIRSALEHIGGSYLDRNEPEKALVVCQRKYIIEKRSIRKSGIGVVDFIWLSPVEFSETCNLLGGCHLQMGRLDDAMMIFQEGLHYTKEFTIQCGPDTHSSRRAAWSQSYLLNNIAEVFAKQSKFADAVKLRQRVLLIREKIEGKNSYGYAEACFSLGSVLIGAEKDNEGINYIKKSREIAMQELGPLHPHVMKCDELLAADRNGVIIGFGILGLVVYALGWGIYRLFSETTMMALCRFLLILGVVAYACKRAPIDDNSSVTL